MKTKKKKTKVEFLFPLFKVNGFLRKGLRLKLIRCTILLGIIFAFSTTTHQLFSLHGASDYQLIDNTTMMASTTTEWGFDQMLQLNPPDDSKINDTGGYLHYQQQQQQQLNHSAAADVAATATTSTSAKIRIIWGIMSHNLYDEEIQRRKVIRETYLQYYQDTTSSPYTICSLNDLVDGRVLYPEQCRLAYVFVLGNSNIQQHGPSMLLEYNDSYPLTVVNTNNSETDIVILNIRENGNDGKSPTWFRYATSLLNVGGLLQHSSVQFSYIFKSDSDNLVFPPLLFDFIDTKLPVSKVSSLPEPSRQQQTPFHPSPTTLLVYGGRIITKEKCYAGFTKMERCESLIGPLWIGGGCYFLSVPLARFISDPKSPFDQYAVKLPHEDMCTSNFVYSYPNATTNDQTIHIISEPIRKNQPVYRKHPIKDVAKYRMEWNKYIQQDHRRRRKKNQ